jgi:hypothetical protein
VENISPLEQAHLCGIQIKFGLEGTPPKSRFSFSIFGSILSSGISPVRAFCVGTILKPLPASPADSALRPRRRELPHATYIKVDEIPIRCLEPGKGKAALGQL